MKKLITVILIIIVTTACNNKLDGFEGTWIAYPGNQIITKVDKEKTIGGKKAYYLKIDGKGNYTLELEQGIQKGTYIIKEDNKGVILKEEDGLISENCTLENETELHCDRYALLYEKADKKIK